jgi:glycine/D-amino acid oxidase-like deaminating enzyme
VKRDSFPDLEMNPAPGFDPLMPHDFMHLIVEALLGLKRGIFGQLAAGGDAGTFHTAFDSKAKRRIATRTRKRGRKLLKEGRGDCALSEKATFLCWHEWRTRASSTDPQKASKAMTEEARLVRDVLKTNEIRALNTKKLDEICHHLDELSSRWSRLQVGESIAVRWPDLAVSADSAALALE